MPSSTLELFGIPIHNTTMQEAIESIVERLGATGEPCQMCFVNAHCGNVACVDATYAAILRQAERVFADGIGVKLAGKLHGVEIVDNVNGTDLLPPLLAALEGTGHGVYFLGAKPGVVDGLVEWVRRTYPGVRVAGSHHGYFTRDEESQVIDEIRASGATLLLVAMGVPTQEKWLEANLGRSGARVGIGVGALFDFYSGTVPRAPLWMRRVGLEWLFRLGLEPKRMWRRYVVGNPLFLWRALRNRIAVAAAG